ncbi:hypothetical protein NUU61_006397 [Penicillium alfredii]|uniref:Copper-fist domain-containing protein n=1 Tax=Penicillium alfredii TaxID=1506179 RepID=A0A9W9F0U5_9EURO|nr:uncharacterized protein NUU61_006397 [Penicillium alfredii]KAJ5091527.1 hypothetical protein NUU61_006397 [Penicillium alfredii]
MPLDEEGAKWSCEPCIRGHRSSKCQHFDRLMMKVPKAGRPLAKCPHPKGTCSCQKTYAVMVRIPKGSTCLCRPLYEVPVGVNESAKSPAPVSSPASKVQKPGRRQSNIQAAPESIAKALDAMPPNLKFENGTPSYQPGFSGQDNSHAATPNHNNQPSPPSQESVEGDMQPPKASCCSQKLQEPNPTQNGGSCCGSSTVSSKNTSVSNSEEQKPTQPTWNDMSHMQFSAPQIPWQSPPVHTNGQFMQPYGQAAPAFYMNGYTQNVSSSPSMVYPGQMNGLGITQPPMGSFQSNHTPNPTFPPSTALGGDCHDCHCGDDCQCLGCATHPFNNTTRQHVQEMGVMITSNGDDQNPDATANAYHSPFPGSTAASPLNFFVPNTPSLDQHAIDTYADPRSNLPSGYSSPLSAGQTLNQQLMHPSEYYTLEYPVGLPSTCSDVTGSCQCGSDCSCIGCLTHSGHNGVPLDAPIPESSVAEPARQESSSHAPPQTSSAPSHTYRIPVLENVSVPCMSPQTLETSII